MVCGEDSMSAFQRTRDIQRVRHRAHERLKEANESGAWPYDADKTLVIIDMQPAFLQDNDGDLIEIICGLIEQAKGNTWAIIVVEYDGYGDTVPEIMESTGSYQHCEIIKKLGNDGGSKVLGCLSGHPGWPLDLLVCGVMGNVCVPETVAGLFRNSSLVEVSVVSDAVSPTYLSCSELDVHGNMREQLITSEDIHCNVKV